jgi:hypothetical protein
MATYSELKEEILLSLDLPSAMVGDVSDLVSLKMYRVVESLCAELSPLQLIKRTGSVTIDSSTTSIPLGATGFDILDEYAKVIVFQIDKNTTDDHPPETYEYLPYQSWLMQNTARAGNLRTAITFTINPDFEVEIRDYPSGDDEWSCWLYYLARPTAITSNGIPEIPILHHGIIVTGTVLEFPQYFQGDRQALLAMQMAKYEQQRRQLLRDRDISQSQLLMRLSPSIASTTRDGIWPLSRVLP